MNEVDDLDLLRQYTRHGSDGAFTELVSRRIGFVYSAALRQVRDPYLAEEVTQAVFIILAQKAEKISDKTIFAGWLFKTTRYAAIAQTRDRVKRQRREQEVLMQSEIQSAAPDPLWDQMSPVLDEALATLGEADRQAVLLRFFENKSLAQVGHALGTGEDTARKRVSRALEKLHRYLNKHGVNSTTAIIAGALSTNSVHAAPVTLAKTVTSVAIAKTAMAGTSTLTLIKGALKIMAWTKAKMAIITGAGILLVAGATVVTVQKIQAVEGRAWQQKYDLFVTDQLPPQVKILPSPPARQTLNIHTWGSRNGKILGLGQSIAGMMMAAYDVHPGQLIISTPLPAGEYDFISNLPRNQPEALQQELKRKFKLVGRRELIETNVLFLKIRTPKLLARLQRAGFGHSSYAEEPGSFMSHEQSLWALVDYLRRDLGILVVDQTRMSGDYNIDLEWDSTPEGLKRELLDKLGLELVPSHEPVEFLIVETVK
ncbi:MAG TPA: TIGR03435 family protein [Candidatus Acidoferrales bacterium]|jgi:uncharacterized protein (TIGR03435 family)|nr:TIGR03435 family protein [Candidatus Acidoferrales bacterium]